ncbi:MAG: rfaE bifunctional protein kinase chain/domain [Marinoscillum sp.]|jgi:rfaE bifunctional protein kinase chain/domain
MTFHSIDDVFDAFKGLKVIIIGDVMLDEFHHGSVSRMSPENSSTPILSQIKTERRLGGAANVAANIQALGGIPYLISPIGMDYAGQQLVSLMESDGLSTEGLIECYDRKTTVKSRFYEDSKQVLRVDFEDDFELTQAQNDELQYLFSAEISSSDLVLFQDYDKGCLNARNIPTIIAATKGHHVKVAIDPKFKNFWSYQNVDLIKPNFLEFVKAFNLVIDESNVEIMQETAAKYLQEQSIGRIQVSLSGQGMFHADLSNQGILPAHPRTVLDVSGAGDTVFAVSALCLALGTSSGFAAELSNIAGGLVCEEFGTAIIDIAQLKNEASGSANLNGGIQA